MPTVQPEPGVLPRHVRHEHHVPAQAVAPAAQWPETTSETTVTDSEVDREPGARLARHMTGDAREQRRRDEEHGHTETSDKVGARRGASPGTRLPRLPRMTAPVNSATVASDWQTSGLA